MRADAVREYLIEQGVEPERLTAVGFGEDRPIDTNRTSKGEIETDESSSPSPRTDLAYVSHVRTLAPCTGLEPLRALATPESGSACDLTQP